MDQLTQEKLKLQAEIKKLTRQRSILLSDCEMLNTQLRPNAAKLKALKGEEADLRDKIKTATATLKDAEDRSLSEMKNARLYGEDMEKRMSTVRAELEGETEARLKEWTDREQVIHNERETLERGKKELQDNIIKLKFTISEYDKLLQDVRSEAVKQDQERQGIDRMRVETTAAYEQTIHEKQEMDQLYRQADTYSKDKIKEADMILDSARHLSQGVADRLSEIDLRERQAAEREHKNRRRELWLDDREQTLARSFEELRLKGGTN